MDVTGRILVVDDNRLTRFMLTQQLTQHGHTVEFAENGWEALGRLGSEMFDLVLLDLNMPEMDGHEVLRQLRQMPDFHRLPVVVVSGQNDVDVIAKCIQSGAEDFLTKPFDPTILKARVQASLEKKHLRDADARHTEELQALKEQLEKTNSDLTKANGMLERFAFTDVLTDLPNRRFALENLSRLWQLFQRSERTFSCLIADVDSFKSINDLYGHDYGDQILVQVANRLKETVRGCDLVCRYGGEEFLVVCPDTELEGALGIGERMRASLSSHDLVYKEFAKPVTASFGVAAASKSMEKVERLLRSADEALYLAKQQGRNRVVACA